MTEEDLSNDSLKFCECGCGEVIPAFDSQGRPRKYKHGHFFRVNKFPQYNNMNGWKGGIHHHLGYIYVRKKDHHFANGIGYIFEHRIVWEEYHKACLLPWGVVHHINHKTTDNRVENLEAMMHGNHGRLHNKKDMTDRKCFLCDAATTRKNSKGSSMWMHYNKDYWVCYRCNERKNERLRRKRKKNTPDFIKSTL